MNNLRIRRALTISAVGLVTAAVVAAALLSWPRVFSAGIALLLAVAIVLLLDIRWRAGASAEQQRATFREAREARSRAGAVQGAVSDVRHKLDSIRDRVELGERRLLGSVESANLQARDWRMDLQDAIADERRGRSSLTGSANDHAPEGPASRSQQRSSGSAYP